MMEFSLLKSYMRRDGSSLPHQVGVDTPDGLRRSDGRGGFLCFGPYCSLPAGEFVAGYYLRRIGVAGAGGVSVDVVEPVGGRRGGARIEAGDLFEDIYSFLAVPVDATRPLDQIEVRLLVDKGVFVEVKELVVFSTKVRDWSTS